MKIRDELCSERLIRVHGYIPLLSNILQYLRPKNIQDFYTV